MASSLGKHNDLKVSSLSLPPQTFLILCSFFSCSTNSSSTFSLINSGRVFVFTYLINDKYRCSYVWGTMNLTKELKLQTPYLSFSNFENLFPCLSYTNYRSNSYDRSNSIFFSSNSSYISKICPITPQSSSCSLYVNSETVYFSRFRSVTASCFVTLVEDCSTMFFDFLGVV